MKKILLILLLALLAACESVPEGRYVVYPENPATIVTPVSAHYGNYHGELRNWPSATPRPTKKPSVILPTKHV